MAAVIQGLLFLILLGVITYITAFLILLAAGHYYTNRRRR